MSSMTRGQQAVAGALATVFLLATCYLGAKAALGFYNPTYRLSVVFGQAGQGIVNGSDVKIRGVNVGRVGDITLDENLQATAELILKPQYEVPERSMFAITGKTLLGEKQVEITFDGSYEEGPYLADGSHISDPNRVVEFQDVLAQLAEFFGAIDPDDLATVIEDGIGAFDDQGPHIARSIDEGRRALDVGVRVLDDQVASTRDLSLFARRIGREGAAFNTLAEEAVRGLPTITDNQAEIAGLLDDLSRFSRVLNATLTIDRPDLDRMIVEGDSVTRMLFAYTPEIGEVIAGLNQYTSEYAGGGYEHPSLQGQAAYFEIIIDTHLSQELCKELPPEITDNLTACGGKDPIDTPDLPAPPDLPLPGAGAQSESDGDGDDDVRVPLGRMSVPRELTRPETEERSGVRSLLERSLQGTGTGGGDD